MSNSYQRVNNTVVNGNELLSNLSGDDIRALNFQDAINNEAPLGDVVAPVLSVDQLVQAATSRMLVAPTTVARIGLGADSQENAASYVRLFNFTSTNQQRVLTFNNAGVQVVAGSTVQLGLNSGVATHVWVNVQQDYAGDAAVQTLLSGVSGSQTPSGRDVLVTVYPSNVTAGSEVVNFSIASVDTYQQL